jgi:tripeptide aminopeptidase
MLDSAPMRTLLDRFLDYVRIDTQSDEHSTTCPSTPGQWDLLRLLESELRALGAADVRLTEHGFVLATVPATSPRAGLPTVALFAHVDTARDYSGHGVKPIVHRRYDGRPIVLPDDPKQVLDPAQIPELAGKAGETIVTASGLTLLGADDKAGVAIVMTLVARLLADASVPHGPIRICFNPDEEIGTGVDRLALEDLGADVAYTIDAENPGDVQYESFSADKAVVSIDGVSIHPGTAKDKMVNAVHLLGKLLAALPREGISPETTEGRQGYIHPYELRGNAARAEARILLRDFERDGLAEKGARLRALCAGLAASEPRARIACEITPQYRNMRYWLEDDMRPVDFARRAIEAVGLVPSSVPIRGGTDGSRLTERGLPTPNLFDGAHCVHGPLEWVCLEDMERAVDVLVQLVQIWERDGSGYSKGKPGR